MKWEEHRVITPNDWIQEKMLPFYDTMEKGNQNMHRQIRREEQWFEKTQI